MNEAVARRSGVRVRSLVDCGVAQQGPNRVIERRRRELDLAPRGCVAVSGNDRIQQLELDRSQDRLVLLREPAIPGDQRPGAAVALEVDWIQPGELLPDLQVAQVVHAEAPYGCG